MGAVVTGKFTADVAAAFPEYDDDKYGTVTLQQFAHSIGIEVHVWTVNEESEMTQLLDMGADGIITDHPARLLNLIRKRPAKP